MTDPTGYARIKIAIRREDKDAYHHLVDECLADDTIVRTLEYAHDDPDQIGLQITCIGSGALDSMGKLLDSLTAEPSPKAAA